MDCATQWWLVNATDGLGPPIVASSSAESNKSIAPNFTIQVEVEGSASSLLSNFPVIETLVVG